MPVVSVGWAAKFDQGEAESPDPRGAGFLVTMASAGILRSVARTPCWSSHSDCMGADAGAFLRRGICVLIRFLGMRIRPLTGVPSETQMPVLYQAQGPLCQGASRACRFLDNPSSFAKVVT